MTATPLPDLTATSVDQAGSKWDPVDYLLATVAGLLTLAIYLQVRSFQFINYDDQDYITENRHVLTGLSVANLRWASTAIVSANWHPVTMYVELLLSSLFGLHAGAYHLVNALIHAVTVGLTFTFLYNATGRRWPAFLVALLWGVHPLRVESVAWISELKDVLCALFCLLSLIAYTRYSRRRSIGNYAVVLVMLVLALLSKPMAVTIPAVLLLLDYWPLQNRQPTRSWWTARVLEKLPLLAIAVADIGYAIRTQTITGAISRNNNFPLSGRLSNAVISVAAYLRDTIWPAALGVFHPHPAMIAPKFNAQPGAAVVISCLVLLLIITAVAFIRARQNRCLLVGWLWFLGMLVPVLGFIQIGQQARADRYTYLPSIGLIMAVVYFAADRTAASRSLQKMLAGAVCVAAAVLMAVSYRDIGYWSDSFTLFSRADAVIPHNYVAKDVLSVDDRFQGNKQAGLQQANEAIEISPIQDSSYVVRGLALRDLDQYEAAVNAFNNAIALNRTNADAWSDIGDARAYQAVAAETNHKPPAEVARYRQQAIHDYQVALSLDPDKLDAADHLANQLAWEGRLTDAIAIWRKLVETAPEFPDAHGHLGDALRLQGDLAGAIEQYRLAIANRARDPGWETELAYLTATSPAATVMDVQPMLPIAKDAVDQTQGKRVAALDAYAACLARVGRFDDAVSNAQAALALAQETHQPRLEADIRFRLDRYRKGLTYVAGDKPGPSTTPSTTAP